jgi:hypothetical protein
MFVKKVFFIFTVFSLFLMGVALASTPEPSPKIPPNVSALSRAKLIEIKPNKVLMAQMNKPNGSVYNHGETIWFTVKNNVQGYLYILDIPPEGTVTQLFPNYYQKDNFVRIGTHKIPSIPRYKFTISGKDSGLEFVEYILSSQPINYLQNFPKTKANPFPTIGKTTKKEFVKFKLNLMKSLTVVPKKWTAWTYFYVNNGKTETLLNVKSTPSGVKVVVDGKFYGTTPLTKQINPGYHSITLSLDGYKDWNGTIYVEFGQTKSLNIKMMPLTQTIFGKLNIVVGPDDAVVYVDGKKIGSGEQTLTLLVGYHSVEVKHEGYQTYYNDSVEVTSNETTVLKVKLTPLTANLYIHSQPYVNVYVDGVFAGGTGYDGVLYLQGVKVGHHKIRFSEEWYIDQIIEYDVLPGDNYISAMLTAAGMLKVNSNVYPVFVKVDNKDFGKIDDSSEGLYVPIGSHTIVFSNPEYLEKKEILNFNFQKTTRVNLNLKLKPLSMSVNISPNPFSPNGDWYEDTTTFHVNLSRKGTVKIQIYSNDKLIWYREFNATYGDNEMSWDGNSIEGTPMPNGVYKVVFTVNSYGQTMTKSMNVVINKNNYTYFKEILIVGGIILAVGILFLILQ